MKNIKTEIIAGITNYFTVIYFAMLVPEILTECFYENQPEVLVSLTIISFVITGISTVVLGVYAHLPIVEGPSIGIAVFLSYTLCKGFGCTYPQALGIVFVSGVIFYILSVTGAEEKIHGLIPANIKYAAAAGTGFFIIYSGLVKSHIIEYGQKGYRLLNFKDYYYSVNAILVLVVVVFIIVLLKYKIHSAVFIGKIVCIIIAIPLGLVHYENVHYSLDFGRLLFNIDFFSIFENMGVMTFFAIIFSICIMDIFETIAVYITMDFYVNKSHNTTKNIRGILKVDAVSSCLGALLGMTTVSTYAESTAGIAEGGRTGLTSIVTGVLFLLSVPFAPFMSIIPSAATATTLIAAGVMMMNIIKKIDFEDIAEGVPAIFTIILMPLTGSIVNGIGVGIIMYTIINIFSAKRNKTPVPLVIMSVLFGIMIYFLWF